MTIRVRVSTPDTFFEVVVVMRGPRQVPSSSSSPPPPPVADGGKLDLRLVSAIGGAEPRALPIATSVVSAGSSTQEEASVVEDPCSFLLSSAPSSAPPDLAFPSTRVTSAMAGGGAGESPLVEYRNRLLQLNVRQFEPAPGSD